MPTVDICKGFALFPGLGTAPENFARMVESMSAGRMKIRVYGAGEMVPALEVFDAVSAGTVNSKLLPKRVALLDPFYSNYAKSYLGNKWVGEVCRSYVSELKGKGVIFETYRSSGASSTGFIGDSNSGLMNMTAFTELKPWYFNSVQLTEKHNSAVWHYLWSFSFNPPAIRSSTAQGASARTADSRIKTLMDGSQKLVHYSGQYTKEPSDDSFELKAR